MTWLLAVIAFLVGVVAGVLLLVSVMKRAMIKADPSQLSFDETERRLREGLAPGWGFPIPEMDFVEALAKKGFTAPRIARAKIFFICNPRYASGMVGLEHRMMGMMPCHWALYETAGGKVFVSRLNIPLMSRMFSGAVGQTLSQVARDEQTMIPRVIGGAKAPIAAGAATSS